eukprot:COSAG02_NODE_19833_length_862_cov_1.386632_1_plen_121_part_00
MPAPVSFVNICCALIFLVLAWTGCNNPAPWVHPNNGTIYIVCGNTMKRAEHISGPWTVVTTFSHAGGPAGAYEDPYLYTDQHGWHLLYHVYTTGENCKAFPPFLPFSDSLAGQSGRRQRS